ncbi:MAG TPA: multiheme c-type cytochrome [Dissulfurispiraceae bacterium]|nr:multiheme c-type cytochrome [Dissulfurispiraceae bacterium]
MASIRIKAAGLSFLFFAIIGFLFFISATSAEDKEGPSDQIQLSPQTRACLGCHSRYTPGIVGDWQTSRHSRTIPGQALTRPVLERRISTETIPDTLSGVAVGCFECHSLNATAHKDNFNHFGFRINVVVSPDDCSTCHPNERKQFADSKKAHAIKNLMSNPVYHTLVSTVTGMKTYEQGRLVAAKPSETTLHESCLGCHGTKVEVTGMQTLHTEVGDISVPKLTNWPNEGVGRENPDGSLGACTACHPRHGFSIEVARKPYTCSQCHIEPDVPAWNVYEESKHGNIYSSKHHEWNFNAVPWKIGKDFKTPTCSTCHNSLVVSPQGDVIAERSHDFGARLWVRLFGLIYAHPQPKSGNTTIINNKDGLPLPTAFSGEPASEYLIDAAEQSQRSDKMKNICKACHGSDWVNRHFAKLDNTIKETNEMTLTATKLMMDAWQKGIEDKANPFDEPIEQMWVRQWLFYANSVRYSSAMTGAPDFTSFNHGWWDLTNNLLNMKRAIDLKSETIKQEGK